MASADHTEPIADDDPERHTLVVTGPERDRLFARFSTLFFGREGVEVVKDRREAERRNEAARADEERRAGERRATSDWVVPPE